MSISVGKTIYSILSNNTNITNKVSTNIYPLIADVNTTFPFIIYKRTSINPSYTKDEFSGIDEDNVEIIIASNKYDESVEVAELVRTALEGKKGMQGTINIKNIRLIGADEDYIEDTFIQCLQYKIKTICQY
jgi:hypothetical protein